MFNAQQKASVYKLLPILKGATYVSGGAGLPAKVQKASDFQNLEDGSYLAREYAIPWQLDIDNPARNAGIPFRTLITFAQGCSLHE